MKFFPNVLVFGQVIEIQSHFVTEIVGSFSAVKHRNDSENQDKSFHFDYVCLNAKSSLFLRSFVVKTDNMNAMVKRIKLPNACHCRHHLLSILGMVDPGEHVSETLRREFMEEALDSGALGSKDKFRIEDKLKDFFSTGKEIYKGYVDDPRNTDNAWMETVAFLFHDEDGNKIGQFNLKAGDDAKALQWMDIDETLNLYASHKKFLMLAAKRLGAHWRKVQSE